MLCENLNSKQNPKVNAPYFERYILDPKGSKRVMIMCFHSIESIDVDSLFNLLIKPTNN
jgi:hypothetical protein